MENVEPAATFAAIAVGELIAGKFRVDGELARGGMGVVLAATHQDLQREVVLKLMLPHLARDADFVERFLREARTAAQLRSRHTVVIHDVNRLPNGAPYIVMERLRGTDLAALLGARGRLPVQEAVDYLLQGCEALAEAHACGIVHRDLKPANLFLAQSRPGGRPDTIKVLDFGIAKVREAFAQAPGLTTGQQILGTPHYMAPEQWRGRRDIDARVDIWALGVILYELVSGAVPFLSDSSADLLAKVLTEPPPPLPASIPAELAKLVKRCLEKDIEARPLNVACLATALIPFGPPNAGAAADRVAQMLRVAPPIALTLLGPGSAAPLATNDAAEAPSASVDSGASASVFADTSPATSGGSMDFGNEHDLVARLATNQKPVTFLVGAALNADQVPGVDGIIAIVREEFAAAAGDLARFDAALLEAKGNKYQAAFRHLLKTRGPDVANRIVRRAVLMARIDGPPHVPRRNAEQGDESDCEGLERDVHGWRLSQGVAALGQIIADYPDKFGKAVLTSNFDPLVEVGIVRAGGARPLTTVLDGDSDLVTFGQGCNVVHFHGDWFRGDTLHTQLQLKRERPRLSGALGRILKRQTLVAVAYGGWDDIFTRSLADVLRTGIVDVDVAWAFFDHDVARIKVAHKRLLDSLANGIGGRIFLYANVNVHSLLPNLHKRLAGSPAFERPSPSQRPIQVSAPQPSPPARVNHVATPAPRLKGAEFIAPAPGSLRTHPTDAGHTSTTQPSGHATQLQQRPGLAGNADEPDFVPSGGQIPVQPLSSWVYLTVGIGLFLAAAAMFWKLKDLPAIAGMPFALLFSVTLALSAAMTLFGGMHSSAVAKKDGGHGSLRLRGPAALFVVVFACALSALKPRSAVAEEVFSFRVTVRGPKGDLDCPRLPPHAEVVFDLLAGDRRRAVVSHEKEFECVALFRDIPAKYEGQSIQLGLDAAGSFRLVKTSPSAGDHPVKYSLNRAAGVYLEVYDAASQVDEKMGSFALKLQDAASGRCPTFPRAARVTASIGGWSSAQTPIPGDCVVKLADVPASEWESGSTLALAIAGAGAFKLAAVNGSYIRAPTVIVPVTCALNCVTNYKGYDCNQTKVLTTCTCPSGCKAER